MKYIATATHLLAGLFVFFRCLIVDLLWLWPRQPISFIALILLPRLITLNLPNYCYSWLSIFFDGDVTPSILLLSWCTLLLSGGLNMNFLWHNVGKWKRLCTLSLFLFGPVAWVYKVYLAEMQHASIVNHVNERLSISNNDSEYFRVYNLFDHVTNSLQGKLLKPDMTFAYKTVDLETLKECPNNSFMPGDVLEGSDVDPLMDRGVLELDVYKPRKITTDENGKIQKPGIILHIHGGGWNKGHRRVLAMNYHGGVPHSILEENMIVSVSYRLSCNGVDGNEMLNDLYDATKFVIEHADEWDADGNKIIPWGTSAGGNLALLLAYRFQEELTQIKGVINFYGVTELREQEIINMSSKNLWEALTYKLFIAETRHVCGEADDKEKCFKDMSPVSHVTKNSPPTLTIHGEHDGLVFVSHADALSEALTRENVTHANLVVPGHHDCDVFVSSPCSQAAIHAIKRLTALVFS